MKQLNLLQSAVRWLAALLIWAASGLVLAHEGHDHGAPPPKAELPLLPRFVAQSDEFELVGVISGGQLRIYLDDWKTNAPIDKAQIEIESGAYKVAAKAVAVGQYEAAAGPLAAVGEHALTITIEAGERSDLLTSSLSQGAVAASSKGTSAGFPLWPLALLILLIGVFVLRRNRRFANA